MPGADPMVQVQQVEDTVQEQWFLDILATEGVDAIAVMAHMDVVDPLVTSILTAIRTVLGDEMDVIFLTGHTHYRGYSRLVRSSWPPFISLFLSYHNRHSISLVSVRTFIRCLFG